MMFEKLNILILLFPLCMICSCETTEDLVDLSGESCVYEVGYEAGAIALEEFSTNGNWYAFIKYDNGIDWIKLSQTEGGVGRFSINADIQSNDKNISRSGKIVIKCGRGKIEYTIKQAAKDKVTDLPPASDTIANQEGVVYSKISSLYIKEYNKLFQPVGERRYSFKYTEDKVSAVELLENTIIKTVSAEYALERLVVADEVSVFKDGLLKTIGKQELQYLGNGKLKIGEWDITFSKRGIESMSKSGKSVLLNYKEKSAFKSKENIDLFAVIGASYIDGLSLPNFVYAQKVFYNIYMSDNILPQKLIVGDMIFLYDYKQDSQNRIVRIDEFCEPAYSPNWLKRSIEIEYQ